MTAKKKPQNDLFSLLNPPMESGVTKPAEPASNTKPETGRAHARAEPATAPVPLAGQQPDLHERYLTDIEVAKRYDVSRPTVWRWCRSNPGFLPPRQISPGTTRWALSDLLAFERQMAARSLPGPNRRRGRPSKTKSESDGK